MFMLFDWCTPGSGVANILHIVKVLVDIVHWVVPIGLILMVSIEIIKNLANPDKARDNNKKIVTRLIAAVIVFLIPTLINLVIGIIDYGIGNNTSQYKVNNIGDCWK